MSTVEYSANVPEQPRYTMYNPRLVNGQIFHPQSPVLFTHRSDSSQQHLCARVVSAARDSLSPDYTFVGVFGEHVVENCLREIRRAANKGRPIVVTDDLSYSLIDGTHHPVALKDLNVLEVYPVLIADMCVRRDSKRCREIDFVGDWQV